MEPQQAAEVRRALEAIVESDGFCNAPKLQRFLRYVVEETLEGRESQIKEAVIGLEVYQKLAGYDPRLDATVRVEASKIRSRLDRYYLADTSRTASVRISIPKGTYVPQFEFSPPLGTPTILTPLEPLAVPPPVSDSRWRSGLSLAGLLVGLGLGWGAASFLLDRSAPQPLAKMSPLSDFTSYAVDPAISPDGSFVVYASDRNHDGTMTLWRQRIDGGGPSQVASLPQSVRTPSIAYDGQEIVFRMETDGGTLGTVPAEGGQITSIEMANRGRDPRCSPIDRRVAYWIPQDEQTLDRGGLYVLDFANPGSEPARPMAAFAHAMNPVWSARGTHLIALGTWQSQVPAREYDAWTLDLAGGPPRKSGLFPLLKQLGYYQNTADRGRVRLGDWRDGWLYFSAPAGQGENIFRIRLSENSEVAGKPEAVTSGAGTNNGVRVGPAGRMVYVNSLVSYGLYSAPRVPKGSDGGIERLTHELGLNMRASMDAAGQWAAWERPRRADSLTQLWLADLATGQGREIGAGAANPRAHTLVSPDGRQVAYHVLEDTKQAIYLEPVDGSAPPRLICEDCGTPTDWNRAGTHVLYTTGGRPNGIGLLDVQAKHNATLLDHPSYGLHGARFEVDGDGNGWMALYADTGPRTRQVFAAPVKRFHPAAYQEWIPITDGAHWDLSPAWVPGGRSLYFISQRDGHRCIWEQSLDAVSRRPTGGPAPVYHFHSPERTLMESVTYRGAEGLRVAGGRLMFSLDNTASSLWLRE